MAKNNKLETQIEPDVEVVAEKPQPNIAFVGELPWKPLAVIQRATGRGIRLPEDQSKPFFHEKARYIIQQFPHLYKPIVSKGKENK